MRTRCQLRSWSNAVPGLRKSRKKSKAPFGVGCSRIPIFSSENTELVSQETLLETSAYASRTNWPQSTARREWNGRERERRHVFGTMAVNSLAPETAQVVGILAEFPAQTL